LSRLPNLTPSSSTSLQRRHTFDGEGLAIAEMLFTSNLMALVGGGPMPKFPANKVMIWDDHQKRPIAELPFSSPVRSVKLKNDRIAVALEQKVFLYDFVELRCLYSVETTPNPEGLLALSPSDESTVVAFPGLHAGEVRVERVDTKAVKIIKAHDSPLAALALSHNGKFIATASEKGTLIRVFSTLDGSKVKEVRRGTDPAKIYSLAFSRNSSGGGSGGGNAGSRSKGGALETSNGLPEWLAVSSDKGTVHVFNLTGKVSSGGSAAGGEDVWMQEEQIDQSGGGGGSGPFGSSPTKTASGRLVMKSITSLTVCFNFKTSLLICIYY
jgi:WD40 repeat protein